MRIVLDTMDLREVGLVVYERSIEMYKEQLPKLVHKQKDYMKVMLRKGDVKTYFKPITIESADIIFHIIPSCLGKADIKKYGIRIMIVSEFRYQKQKFYSLMIGNLSQISLYTTHFIERYVERHLGDNSPINIDTFIKYLKETDGISYGFNKCGENELQWVTEIGNSCGCVLDEKVLLHKTFIDKSTIIRGIKKDANTKGNEVMKFATFDKFGDRTFPKAIAKYFNFNINR